MLFVCTENATRINLGPATVLPWEASKIPLPSWIWHCDEVTTAIVYHKVPSSDQLPPFLSQRSQ